jgi:hypothetical protein
LIEPIKEDVMSERVSNEELVQKAVIATDAIAAAGKLNPAQADKFIDYVVDESVLKNNARVERFRNETLEIDKIGIGRRVALPKAEAADPGLRRGIETSKIILEPRAVAVPFEISDEFLETNLEGAALADKIVQLMARQFANDLEELYLLADVLGPSIVESDYRSGGSTTQHVKDEYLGLLPTPGGWLRRADSGHVVDHAGANVGLTVFGAMLRNLPQKFRRNKAALRFFIAPDLAQLYVEKLSTRATGLGDASAAGASHKPYGVQLVEVPLLQFLPKVVEHIVLSGAGAHNLRYKPVQNEVVTPVALAGTPTTPYVEGSDYDMDYANGTITRNGLADPTTVKITYEANPQVLLTHMSNFIVGIGRDIKIEKDRDIYKGVWSYMVTAKVAVQFEEADALVKGVNIGQGV